MTMNKTKRPLLAPHDALIQTEKLVFKYDHRAKADPFHPLEIIGFSSP